VNGSAAVVGNQTFVAGCDSILHILDVKTGRDLHSIDLEGQAGATGAVRDTQFFVGTMANTVQAVDLKKNAIFWTFESPKNQAFYASAAVTDKLVVVGCRDKVVYALGRDDGKLVWSYPTKGRIDSSAVVAGNRVYLGAFDGALYILDLHKGTLVERMDLGRGIAASPAVVDNRLVIGTTDGFLYCLGEKAK
jgi:outer membrane protein assembly factor BamB